LAGYKNDVLGESSPKNFSDSDGNISSLEKISKKDYLNIHEINYIYVVKQDFQCVLIPLVYKLKQKDVVMTTTIPNKNHRPQISQVT